MWFVILVKDDGTEGAATGLCADILVHCLVTQLVEGHGVDQRFAARLDGKTDFCVTDFIALTINRTDCHTPLFRVIRGELRDVRRYLTTRGLFTGLVKFVNIGGELRPLRDDKFVP